MPTIDPDEGTGFLFAAADPGALDAAATRHRRMAGRRALGGHRPPGHDRRPVLGRARAARTRRPTAGAPGAHAAGAPGRADRSLLQDRIASSCVPALRVRTVMTWSPAARAPEANTIRRGWVRDAERSTVATRVPSMLTSMRPLPGPAGATMATARPVKGSVASAPAPRAVRTLRPDALERRRVRHAPRQRHPLAGRVAHHEAGGDDRRHGAVAGAVARDDAEPGGGALVQPDGRRASCPRRARAASRSHRAAAAARSATPLDVVGRRPRHAHRRASRRRCPPCPRVTRGRASSRTSGASRSMRSVTAASAARVADPGGQLQPVARPRGRQGSMSSTTCPGGPRWPGLTSDADTRRAGRRRPRRRAPRGRLAAGSRGGWSDGSRPDPQ